MSSLCHEERKSAYNKYAQIAITLLVMIRMASSLIYLAEQLAPVALVLLVVQGSPRHL